jgi:hypothetical protein
MLGVKAGGATVLMFKVELTREPGESSPALAVVETTDRYLRNAENFARLWLIAYQKEYPGSGASGYRISDEHGKRLKASAI